MNYASLIAVLAALAFTLPFLANLATMFGIARGTSIVTTLAAAIFVTAWIVIRQRAQHHSAIEERIEAISRQRAASPHDPHSFYLYGDHQGDLLLTVGRPADALEAFEAHHRIAHRAGHDTQKLERTIARLRVELSAELENNVSL
jgi:hypothetical protein